MVSAEKQQALQERMDALGIHEDDLVEKFVLGTGHGSQKINKTSSCVYLKHEPTGFEVKCQRGRSQAANRHYAREEICDRIEQDRIRRRMEAQQRAEKARRRNRAPSAAARARAVAQKRPVIADEGMRVNVHGVGPARGLRRRALAPQQSATAKRCLKKLSSMEHHELP